MTSRLSMNEVTQMAELLKEDGWGTKVLTPDVCLSLRYDRGHTGEAAFDLRAGVSVYANGDLSMECELFELFVYKAVDVILSLDEYVIVYRKDAIHMHHFSQNMISARNKFSKFDDNVEIIKNFLKIENESVDAGYVSKLPKTLEV